MAGSHIAHTACKRVAYASTETIAVQCLDRARAGRRGRGAEGLYIRGESVYAVDWRVRFISTTRRQNTGPVELDVSGDAKEGGFRLRLMWRSCGSAWTVITLLTHSYLIPRKPCPSLTPTIARFSSPSSSYIIARIYTRALIYAARRRSLYLSENARSCFISQRTSKQEQFTSVHADRGARTCAHQIDKKRGWDHSWRKRSNVRCVYAIRECAEFVLVWARMIDRHWCIH